jgi:hypothetical protein
MGRGEPGHARPVLRGVGGPLWQILPSADGQWIPGLAMGRRPA